MLAHGFPVPLLVELCIAGLAIATPERMVAGGRPVEVVRMKITEGGGRQSTPGGERQVSGNNNHLRQTDEHIRAAKLHPPPRSL